MALDTGKDKDELEEEEEDEEEEEGEEEEDGEYDLMEYGDEFNDEEERRYAKEMYGTGSRPKRKAREQASEESEPRAPVESLAKSFSRRANRGLKMNALVTRAKEADDNEDDFWGGLGADYFGIKSKKKGGPKGMSEDSDEADENDLLEGMLADDDQDFNSVEASEDDGNDSFDSDFGREEEEESAEDEQGEGQGIQKKKQKTHHADEDEDRLLELQEKREKTKKKVKFHQNLVLKSSKKNQKKDQGGGNKRE